MLANIPISSTTVKRSTTNTILVAVLAYFNLGLIVAVLLGIDPPTTYYSASDYSYFQKLVVLSLNVTYVLIAAWMLRRMLPKTFKLSVYSHWVLIAVAAGVIAYVNAGNLDLTRTAIKENATAVTTLLSAIAYSYLSAIVLCERNRPKFYVAMVVLIFAIVMSYEREVILFLFIPLILRLDRGQIGFAKMGAIFAASVILLMGYKYLAALIRGNMNSSGAGEFWEFVQLSLLRDNLHTGFLELSYFAGRSPDYSNISYFLPVQVERLFNFAAMTNGQMATLYYTGGRTGTGFSALLEAWLNFGPFGVLVLPLLMALGLRRVAFTGSAFLFIATSIFVFKLQRSDLWPAVIGYLLAPISVFILVRLAQAVRRRPQRRLA